LEETDVTGGHVYGTLRLVLHVGSIPWL